MSFSKILIIIYSIYLFVMSGITIYLFIKDKKMAANNGNEIRIKEKTLLSFIAFGGAIGGFIGKIVAHHKTNKIYFTIMINFAILVQIAVLGLLVYIAG